MEQLTLHEVSRSRRKNPLTSNHLTCFPPSSLSSDFFSFCARCSRRPARSTTASLLFCTIASVITSAEYAAVEARNLAPLPGDVDFAVGASLPISGLTAWQGLLEH